MNGIGKLTTKVMTIKKRNEGKEYIYDKTWGLTHD